MKVYVLTSSYDYEGNNIVGIYSTLLLSIKNRNKLITSKELTEAFKGDGYDTVKIRDHALCIQEIIVIEE